MFNAGDADAGGERRDGRRGRGRVVAYQRFDGFEDGHEAVVLALQQAAEVLGAAQQMRAVAACAPDRRAPARG